MDFRSPSGCPAPVALVAPAVVAEAAEGLPALPGLPAPSANEILGACQTWRTFKKQDML